MPVTTARQRVLTYLTKNRAVSATQIARALNMSAANARHHLSVLGSDGRASVVGETKKDGKGRPIKLYGVSENLIGNNLAFLADGLLDEFLKKLSPARQGVALQVLARRLAMTAEITETLNMSKRLTSTIENLNQHNYQARWEAGAEGPRILFGHCPYAAIIEKHPELCRMDAALLNIYMDQAARQIARIERGGSPACVFVMGKIGI